MDSSFITTLVSTNKNKSNIKNEKKKEQEDNWVSKGVMGLKGCLHDNNNTYAYRKWSMDFENSITFGLCKVHGLKDFWKIVWVLRFI